MDIHLVLSISLDVQVLIILLHIIAIRYHFMSKFGDRLIRSLREALAIARGEMKPARIYTEADIAKILAKREAKEPKREKKTASKAPPETKRPKPPRKD